MRRLGAVDCPQTSRAHRNACAVIFTCNICSARSPLPEGAIGREDPSCQGCGSSARFRALVDALSRGLHGESLPISAWPERHDLRGIGMSDWHIFADQLAEKTTFVNSFYHREPRLDVMNVPEELEGRFDYVISSEVFEHVAPPVERAFENVFRLLKPGGLFILTVPHYPWSKTRERFPSLHDYRLVEEGGRWILENRRSDGQIERFEELTFHGGPGDTLEMRMMAAAEIERIGAAVGFASVVAEDADDPAIGVVWERPHTAWPYSLRKGGGEEVGDRRAAPRAVRRRRTPRRYR